jgi:hypothetical protein
MDQHQERRRGHFHRGRRGPDRRGPDRRTPPPQAQERPGRDQVDVEQIMRDIRGRIAQRQGIDLSNQQIQDLAARRLESILDPRAIKPSLLDALRKNAGVAAGRGADKVPNEPTYTFEDTTIYDSHRGALRLMRRWLNPLLKLLFNPNPLIRALHLQAKLNVEAAERDAERDRRQAEWNALHYEIVQRLVTEVSRVTLELQSMSMRVDSLDAKLDFNERRVRSIEGSAHRSRPQGRPAEPVAPSPTVAPSPIVESETAAGEPATAPVEGQPQSADGARRRRRRRRGRRTGMTPGDGVISPSVLGGAPEVRSDGYTAPGPAAEDAAETAPDAEAAPAPVQTTRDAPPDRAMGTSSDRATGAWPDRAMNATEEPRAFAPPMPEPRSSPPVPDDRVAPESRAEPPDPDRTEP